MAAKGKTLSKQAREALRKSALARHAARREAGLPSPCGVPYAKAAEVVAPAAPTPAAPPVKLVPVAEPPRVILRDDGTPAPPKPVVVVVVPEPPRPVVDPAPRDAFKVWLRSGPGRDASDPRLSSDAVRMGAELEDRILAGWLAGYAAGFAAWKDINPVVML